MTSKPDVNLSKSLAWPEKAPENIKNALMAVLEGNGWATADTIGHIDREAQALVLRSAFPVGKEATPDEIAYNEDQKATAGVWLSILIKSNSVDKSNRGWQE